VKKVLLIGAGGIGKRHIRGFIKTGRARLSVVEPDAEKLADVMKTCDIERGYAGLDQAPLAEFDAAVVCSPAHTHISIGQRLADAGLPFLLEKPLAVSMDGVDRMIGAVNKKGLAVRVGYVQRVRPWVLKLKDQLDAGRVGKLRMVYANVSQEYPKYRPDYQRTYYARRASGGGAILDAATHTFDLLLWFLGPVRQVSAMYDRLVLQGVECEDCALISLRFASGVLAQINMNQFQKPNVSEIEWIGDKANLRLVNHKGELQFASDDSGQWVCEPFETGGMTPMEIHESMFAVQAGAYLDIVEGKPSLPLATLEDARQSLRVCLAALESGQTKRTVELE